MTDPSEEVDGVQVPPRDADVNERVAVVAKLRPGSRERAGQILGEGARPPQRGCRAHLPLRAR